MVNHTRLDCVLGSTALHAARRRRGDAPCGASLRVRPAPLEQPLMQNVLADLCLESEAATVTALRLARAFDEGDHAFRRLATAVAKYWVCKVDAARRRRGPRVPRRQRLRRGVGPAAPLPGEPAELDLGGRGQRQLPRRPAGAREVAREPGRLPRRGPSSAGDPGVERAVVAIERELEHVDESRARYLVERLALVLQASLLLRHGDAAVAEAFCATRLDGGGGRAFGTLPSGLELERILERHRPLAAVA